MLQKKIQNKWGLITKNFESYFKIAAMHKLYFFEKNNLHH